MVKYTYKKSHIEQLKAFVAVVESNFLVISAASKLHTVPSSISSKIIALEQELGYNLLIRKGKRIIGLTEEGKELYVKAINSINTLNLVYKNNDNFKNVKKININLLYLKNRVRFVYCFLLKKLQYMALRIKASHLLIFLSSIFVAAYFSYRFQVRNHFIEKNIEITSNIATSILEIERQMNLILENASIALEYHIEQNPNISMNELKAFCNILNVSNCGIQDRDGVVILSSRYDARLEDKRLFYSEHSIKKQIKNFDNLLLMDSKVLPSSFYGALGDTNDRSPRIIKGIDRWSKKLNRILYLKIRSNDIVASLKKFIRSYYVLESVSFVTPSGTVIASTNNNYSKLQSIEKYKEAPSIYENNNNLNVILSFGGMQDEIWTHQTEKERGLTNEAGEYFYSINAVFSKKKLNDQIFDATLYLVLSIVLLVVIYITVIFRAKNKSRSTAK